MDLLDREGVTSVPIHRQALAATMRDGAAAILGMNLTDKQYSEIKDEPLDVPERREFPQVHDRHERSIRSRCIRAGLLESAYVHAQSSLVGQDSIDSDRDRYRVQR
jgi:hypothetical protein